MYSTTAEATINALHTVFATHGLPKELVTDHGAQFITQEFRDFLRGNKIKHILSAPYHPASNGEAELKGSKNFQGNDESCQRRSWDPKSEDNIRSATSRPEEEVAKPSSMQPRALKRQLSVGDPVLIRDYKKSHNPWTKGVIISKQGPVTYGVQVEDFIWKQHIDRMKDLSGTKIQPEAGEVTEDLLYNPVKLNQP